MPSIAFLDAVEGDLRDTTLAGFGSSLVDTTRVRMLAVQLSDSGLQLDVLVSNAWDDLDMGSERAIGHVSLAPVLDEVDRLAAELDVEAFAARATELERALEERAKKVLVELGQREPLVSCDKLLGLWLKGFRGTQHIGWAHPHASGGDLLMLRVRPVNTTKSRYPTGYLHDRGITLFFHTDGKEFGVDWDSHRKQSRVEEHPFANMETAFSDPHGGGVQVLEKGNPIALLFDAGMPHGADVPKEEIEARLLAHMRTPSGLFFDPNEPPEPNDPGYPRWVERYWASNDGWPGKLVRLHADRFGLESAQRFVDTQPSGHQFRAKALSGWAHVLAERGEYERAFDIVSAVKGEARGWFGTLEARLLLMLGRPEEAAKCAKKLAKGHNECAALGLRVHALVELGKTAKAVNEAKKLVEEFPREAKAHYALAVALCDSDLEGASAAMSIAMHSDGFSNAWARHDFSRASELVELLDRVETERRTTKERAEGLARRTRVDVPRISVDRDESLRDSGHALREIARAEYSDWIHRLFPAGKKRWIGLNFNEPARWVEFDPDAAEPEVRVDQIGADGEMIAGALFANETIFTVSNDGIIRGYGVDDLTRPICELPPVKHVSANALRRHDNLLARVHDDGVDLIDISDVRQPRHLSSFSTDRYGNGDLCRDARLVRTSSGLFLYIAANRMGLVTVRLNDPSAPELLSVLTCHTTDSDGDPKQASLEGMHATENVLLVGVDRWDTWVVDILDPASPQSRLVLPTRHESQEVWTSSDDILLYREDTVWRLDHELGLSVFAPLEETGGTVQLEDGRIVACAELGDSKQGFACYETETVEPKSANDRATMDRAIENIERRFDEQLATLEVGFPVGTVTFRCMQGALELFLGPARTRFRLDSTLLVDDSDALVAVDIEPRELFADGDPWWELTESKNRSIAHTIVGWLAEHPRLRELACARLLLFSEGYRTGLELVEAAQINDRPFEPTRAEATGTEEVDIGQALSDAARGSQVDHVVSLCERNPDHLRQVLDLLSTNVWARVAAREASKIDPQATLEAFIDFGESHQPDNITVTFIRLFRDVDPRVDPILEKALASDDMYAVVAAAYGLDRPECDEAVAVIKKAFADGSGYDAMDVLEQRPYRLQEYIPELLQECERAHLHPHEAGRLAALLDAGGHDEIPASLVQVAVKEKKQQEEALGFGMTFDDDLETTCDAFRKWEGRLWAQRLEALRTSGKSDESIWPAELSGEPGSRTWQRFFEAAGPMLSVEQVRFVTDTLLRRVTEDPGDHPADQTLMAPFLWFVVDHHEHVEEAFRLAAAMCAEGSCVADEDRKLGEQVLKFEMAKQAQAAIHEEDYATARAIVDRILQAAPDDSNALFMDAQLVWKTESASAAVRRVEQWMPSLSTIHRPDVHPERARMSNLAGCILEGEGRYREALPWFQRAHAEDPEQIVYMNNLTEIFDKLGDTERARDWATKARNSGSDSEIVRRVLRD